MKPPASRSPRILLVYPRFSQNHLINFEYMVPFYPGKLAVMPPLGLLSFGGCLPDHWPVCLVDENVRELTEEDLCWADVVAASGMHPQRNRLNEILHRANRLGELTILGGPSVSICPEFYPQADMLHVGELGDTTGDLLRCVESLSGKPPRQMVFRSPENVSLEEQTAGAPRGLDEAARRSLDVGAPA